MARKLRDAVDAANIPLGEGPTLQARTLPTAHDLAGSLVETLSHFGLMKQAIR